MAEKYPGTPVRQLLFDEPDYVSCFDTVWSCASLLRVRKTDIEQIAGKMGMAPKENSVLSVSFKPGVSEGERNGRSFNDYIPKSADLIFPCEKWRCLDRRMSGEIRNGREAEQRLNTVADKC